MPTSRRAAENMWPRTTWNSASIASSRPKPASPSILLPTNRNSFSWLPARNQPRAAISREVVVHPLHEHQQAIVELHQVHQVYEDPCEPRRESGDMHFAEIGDRLIAADRREVALVEIMERRGRRAPRRAVAYQPGDVTALLHRHRRYSGQQLAARS